MIHNLWYVEADKSHQCINKDNNTFCAYTKENNTCSSLPSLDPGQIILVTNHFCRGWMQLNLALTDTGTSNFGTHTNKQTRTIGIFPATIHLLRCSFLCCSLWAKDLLCVCSAEHRELPSSVENV